MADLEVDRLDGYAKAAGLGICLGVLGIAAALFMLPWWGWRSLMVAGQVLVVALVWQMLIIVADMRAEMKKRRR